MHGSLHTTMILYGQSGMCIGALTAIYVGQSKRVSSHTHICEYLRLAASSQMSVRHTKAGHHHGILENTHIQLANNVQRADHGTWCGSEQLDP